MLIQTIVLGLITGFIYALTGAGLVSVYRTSRIINFAQASIGTVGLYVAYPLVSLGAPYWLVAIAVIAAAALTSVIVGTIVNFVAGRREELLGGLAAIAASLAIEGILTLTVGGTALAFPSLGNQTLFTLGSVGITAANVGVIVVATIAFILLGLLFSRTTIGIGMRAISENSTAAQTIGLQRTALRLASWLIGGVLAGMAALFLVPLFSLTPDSIAGEIVYGFAAVVIGGFDSIAGALVAGVALGIISNLIGVYLNLNVMTFGLFIVMLAVLLVRPFGLFGRRPLERV